MLKNKFLKGAILATILAGSSAVSFAQDVHFTQFDAAPLLLNPAFTGAFNGGYRVSAIYRDQWRSVTAPFVTYAASFDAPIIHDITTDDYLAAGVQLYNDRAGDGNLNNFSGLASIAYHKFLGGGYGDPKSALSVGFQGGYSSKTIDLSRLYFGDEFQNGNFNPGTSQQYINGLGNSVHTFTVNAGISWSQALGQSFSYVIGLGANNLNQPGESVTKQNNSNVGLGRRYNAQFGSIIRAGERLSFRPGVLFQTQSNTTELIAGNEFHYLVGDPEFSAIATGVFVGAWYRAKDAVMITAGLDYKAFRLGLSYDYNTSELKTASNNNGGFEISLRYTAPNPLDFARKLIYPCARF